MQTNPCLCCVTKLQLSTQLIKVLLIKYGGFGLLSLTGFKTLPVRQLSGCIRKYCICKMSQDINIFTYSWLPPGYTKFGQRLEEEPCNLVPNRWDLYLP